MAKKGSTTYMTPLERILGGVLFVIYLLVLPFVMSPLIQLLGRLLGHGISDHTRNILYYYILFALTLLIFWIFIGRTTSHFLTNTWQTLATLGVGLVAFYGLNELAYRLFRLLWTSQVNLNDVTISAQVQDAPRSTFLIIVFLAPFIEEVLFRGYVFGNLRERSRTAAYIVSCLLFAFLHVWQFVMVERSLYYFLLMFQYLLPGLVLAWTYEKSGTLWGSILLHCFANAMAVWGIV